MKINKKSEENVSTTKIAFWYVVSNFLTVAIGNLTTPIFARLMSTADYGKFSNFLTWQTLLLIVFSLSLSVTLGKARFEYPDKMEEYLSTMVLFGNLLGIVFWLIIELNASRFVKIFNMDMKYIRIMLLDLLFLPAFSLLQTFFRIYNKYKFFIFFSVTSAVIKTLASIVLIMVMEDKFMARMLGYTVPSIFMNLLLWCYIVYRGRTFEWKYCTYALPFAMPLMVNAVAGDILTSSDRIMITKFCGEADTAMYTIAYSCSTIASVVLTGVKQAWTPWVFERLYYNDYTAVRRSAKVYASLFFVFIAGVMLVLPEVLWIFGGDRYMDAKNIVSVIFASIYCQFVYSLYINIETYTKKTYYSMLGTLMAAGINVGLNMLAIPIWGYKAAAYTTFIGYLLLAIFHLLIVRQMKEYRHLFDDRFNCGLMFLLIFYIAICNMLYRVTLIRYVCVIIYGIMILLLFYRYQKNKGHMGKT